MNPPTALVETWILLETCEENISEASKQRAHTGIVQFFGSVEIAQIYIDECHRTN